MIDGGLWANNPVMNGLVDALSCFDVDRSQIQILSLGCGENSFTVSSSKAKGGLLPWYNAITAALSAPSRNAPETPKAIPLDDHRRAATELPNMGRSLIEASGAHIARVFLNSPAQPYYPIVHGND
jgi:hypothetical protein